MAETNLIKKADLAWAREQEFVETFNGGIRKLMEALGVTRKLAKTAGTVLKAYKATGTLESGIVAEGDTIPLSKYTTEPVEYGEITLNKWRKATSAEAIIERGYDQAVVMTYPLIGSYGMTEEDYESDVPGIGALIILLLCIPEGAPEANQYGEPDAQ